MFQNKIFCWSEVFRLKEQNREIVAISPLLFTSHGPTMILTQMQKFTLHWPIEMYLYISLHESIYETF